MRTVASIGLVVALSMGAGVAAAHEGHDHGHVRHSIVIAQAEGEHVAKVQGITGQAPYQFRVKTRVIPNSIPKQSWEDLGNAHGGFAVDHRPGRGEAYFGLPNTGILRLSADMNTIDVLDASPELRDGGTMHNTTIWYDADGEAFLVFPGVDRASILTTNLDGKLVGKLPAPIADEMTVPAVKEYFAAGNGFVPTDVEYFGGLYYITTGYSPLDYVLTAKITSTKPFAATWNALAFGGKGDDDGQFRTGHGITVDPDGKHLVVADRPKNRLERFTPEGQFVDKYMLPEGTLPCDVDYLNGYTLVPCLEGADKTKGAPIYLIKDGKIVSTIMCRDELGLPRFNHIHNAVLREVDGKLYVIAQAWNPGDFVVLEQVSK